MTARSRFAVLLALFVVWIGFLFYLAFATRNPVVLSRPQFLASTLDAIVQLDDPKAAQVQVVEVHWPEKDKSLAGQTIAINHLGDCIGWRGPGQYIVPLVPDTKGTYRVATPARSLGFDPYSANPWQPYTSPQGEKGWKHAKTEEIRCQKEQPREERIYLATADAREQLARIPKPQCDD